MSRGVKLATFFYLAHIFCSGWVASSELGTIFFAATVAYLIWRKQLRPSFHILYFPLFVYALDSSISSFANGASKHAFGEIALWLKCLLFPAALILFRNVPRTRDLAVKTFRSEHFVLRQRRLEACLRRDRPLAQVPPLSGRAHPLPQRSADARSRGEDLQIGAFRPSPTAPRSMPSARSPSGSSASSFRPRSSSSATFRGRAISR